MAKLDDASGPVTAVPAIGVEEGAGKRERRKRRDAVDGERLHQVVARVTGPELEELRAIAADHGITLSRLLLKASLSYGRAEVSGFSALPAAERRELIDRLERLELAIARVGVNVNQMTKVVHSTSNVHKIRAQFAGAQDYLDNLGTRVADTLAEVRA